MNSLIKFEEFAKMFFAWWLSLQTGNPWWFFFVWLLVPDLCMIGYVVNAKIGAWLYNFVHHQAVAIIVGLVGFYLSIPWLIFTGTSLVGHSAMGRGFG